VIDDELANMYQRYLAAEPGLELRRMFLFSGRSLYLLPDGLGFLVGPGWSWQIDKIRRVRPVDGEDATVPDVRKKVAFEQLCRNYY
jgi:hypothetical protein